ncbi:MAG: pepsin/retropepsin-like aspartic protease family protein [Thermoplasmataceae archaeon]
MKMNALIDSGAEGNYISKILPNGLGPVQLGFVSYSEIPVSIPGSSSAELHGALTFKSLTMNGIVISEPEFIILDNIDLPAIIGVEILQMLGLSLDFKSDVIRP